MNLCPAASALKKQKKKTGACFSLAHSKKGSEIESETPQRPTACGGCLQPIRLHGSRTCSGEWSGPEDLAYWKGVSCRCKLERQVQARDNARQKKTRRQTCRLHFPSVRDGSRMAKTASRGLGSRQPARTA